MTISELCKEAHKTAIDKGWYDSPRTSLELLMLVVTEISEAAEHIRKGNLPLTFKPEIVKHGTGFNISEGTGAEPTVVQKPDGEMVELADAVIRIADYCEFKGYDLEAAIKLKMQFNQTRPYRHGGKKF